MAIVRTTVNAAERLVDTAKKIKNKFLPKAKKLTPQQAEVRKKIMKAGFAPKDWKPGETKPRTIVAGKKPKEFDRRASSEAPKTAPKGAPKTAPKKVAPKAPPKAAAPKKVAKAPKVDKEWEDIFAREGAKSSKSAGAYVEEAPKPKFKPEEYDDFYKE